VGLLVLNLSVSSMLNIHIIWIGESIPNDVKKNIEAWEEAYPKSILFWDQNRLASEFDDYLNFRNLHPAQIADIYRVQICSKFGGWYVDADTQPGELRILEEKRVVLVKERQNQFLNGFFHLPKNHPFANTWSEEISHSLNAKYENIALQTGPAALNRAIYRFSRLAGRAEIQKSFAYIPQDKFRLHDLSALPIVPRSYFERSYGVHMGLRSWQEGYARSNKFHKLRRRVYQELQLYPKLQLSHFYLTKVIRLNPGSVRNICLFSKVEDLRNFIRMNGAVPNMVQNQENKILYDFLTFNGKFIILNKKADILLEDLLKEKYWRRLILNIWTKEPLSQFIVKEF
jgi:hypothetical protein